VVGESADPAALEAVTFQVRVLGTQLTPS